MTSSLRIAGMRGADPRRVYPAAHLVEARVVALLAILALGTGLGKPGRRLRSGPRTGVRHG